MLYTIVEWLLKSARKDNRTAALKDYVVLNKLGQLNVQLLLYAPVIALFYEITRTPSRTIMPPTKKRNRSWINNIPFFAKQAKLCSATLGNYVALH